MTYHSQCRQDEFCVRFFNGISKGTFVEIGAHDGIRFSNTYALEKEFAWRGVCVEPNPTAFLKLKHNRRSHCINVAAGERSEEAVFIKASGDMENMSALATVFDKPRFDHLAKTFVGGFETIRVNVLKTQDIFDRYCLTAIDYLSIDTDGSELDVLKGIDWAQTQIKLVTVEDLSHTTDIHSFMRSVGYNDGAELDWDYAFWKT